MRVSIHLIAGTVEIPLLGRKFRIITDAMNPKMLFQAAMVASFKQNEHTHWGTR